MTALIFLSGFLTGMGVLIAALAAVFYRFNKEMQRVPPPYSPNKESSNGID